jgi:hypothetical protein
MKPAEIGSGKALLAHHRHREGIAERQGHGRGGRGSHRFRTHFRPMREHQRGAAASASIEPNCR